MPLSVHFEDGEKGEANLTWQYGENCNPVTLRQAVEGGYWISTATTKRTALLTASAATCTIIVVHASDGTGALGHYAGTANAEAVARGVAAMISKLDKEKVETIVFAAGYIGGEPDDRIIFKQQIVAHVTKMQPKASVFWAKEEKGKYWSHAMYLPVDKRLAFFDDLPNANCNGRDQSIDGFKKFSFPADQP